MKTIKLSSYSKNNYEYACLIHPDLKNPVFISWDHFNESLTLEKKMVFPDQPVYDLNEYQYLILSPDYKDYKWKLELIVNKKTKKLELKIIERANGDLDINGDYDFKIIDNQ